MDNLETLATVVRQRNAAYLAAMHAREVADDVLATARAQEAAAYESAHRATMALAAAYESAHRATMALVRAARGEDDAL